MGNNTSQTKKKKESTKMHPNFLFKKTEKNEGKTINLYINFLII